MAIAISCGMDSIAVIDETGNVVLSGHRDPVPWWSVTKMVLAIAALRLVENRALSLDEPIAGEDFTLRQLLRHEAGLPDYGVLPQYHADVAAGKTPWPVEQLLSAVEARRLRYEPGTDWAYSNVGYLKVKEMIEAASGLTLGAALQSLVFVPSRLSSARLATQPGDLCNVQMGDADNYHPGWVYHGLVVGTAADAARLLETLMVGRLLRPEMLAEMLKRRALPQYRSATHPDPAHGLGLMLWENDPTDHPIGHSGAGPGSRIAVYARHHRIASVWAASSSPQDPEVEVFAFLS
jgi:CubicO group peptidase (beta-lactamase class C family)